MDREEVRVLVYTVDRDAAYGLANGVIAALALLIALLAFLPASTTLERDVGPTLAVAWRAGIPAAAFALLVGWSRWLRRCVRRIHWLPGQQVAMVETYGLLRRPLAPLDPRTITGVVQHDGTFRTTLGIGANAPYRRIRRSDGHDLVLDDQGRVVDAARLAAILAGRID